MTQERLYKWGMCKDWITEESTDTQWKYYIAKDTLYIAFQGSISKLDWLQNFSFWTKPYRKQSFRWYAHAGFVKKWKSVEDDVLQVIRGNGVKEVVVFGFSQGAALATLCHESIWYNFPEYRSTLKTYTYGSPRVVWFWNKRRLKKRFETLRRFAIDRDLVPKVPPCALGYRHVGDEEKLKGVHPFWKIEKNHLSYGGLL